MSGARSTQRTGLIALAVFVSAAIAASGVAYPSSYAPALVGGAIAGAVILVTFVRRPIWALYAALFSVMLPIGLLPPTVQSNLNRSLTVLAFTVWLVSVLLRRRPIIWTAAASFMFAFVIWGLATLLWADYLDAGLNSIQVYTLRLVLFLLLVINQIRAVESLNGLMKTLALSGWVLVLAGLGTLVFEGYTPGSRFQILEMNENQVGLLALVTLPGVLWQAIRSSGWQRAISMFLSFAFVAIVLTLVAMTGSRGSAISLGITLLAFWIWKPTRPWAKLGLAFLAVAVVTMPLLFSTLMARFALAGDDTVLGGREAIWQATLQLIRVHPWSGVGIGGAKYAVVPYVISLRNVGSYEDVAIHNPVLDILAGTGLPGIVLYLGVLTSAAWLFVSQYRKCARRGANYLGPYFALVSSVFAGYMASWIKGGGAESDFGYFLILSLLIIPSGLAIDPAEDNSHRPELEADQSSPPKSVWRPDPEGGG